MQVLERERHPVVKLLPVMLILAAATVLRCYKLASVPLTNDELSALYRLRFSSLSDLILYGVMPDGHPAFVQVFLYGYTACFGTSPVALKLPFICCGIASVYVAYLVFGRLLSERTGLFVAAFMATSQFFVMHSQVARPYAPGLLLLLLLVHQLAVVTGPGVRKRHYLLITLLLTLLASTHYFALLTGMVAALFFSIQAGAHRKPLVIACFAAALLYLPQLPVFIHQLKVGGVAWLGRPGPRFVIGFLSYLGHFETVQIVLFCAGVLVSVCCMFVGGATPAQRRKLLLSAGVFSVTCLVLFGYSLWRTPVLQYPALLFATPFLVAFAVYPASLLPWRIFAAALTSFIVLQCYTLIEVRRHYEIFYHQGYQAAVQTIAQKSAAGTPLLLNGNEPFYFEYYFNREGIKPNMIHARIDSLGYREFGALLRSVKADTIVLAHAFSLPGEYVSLAREVFGIKVFEEHHPFNDTYILARGIVPEQADSLAFLYNNTSEFGPGQKTVLTASGWPVDIEVSCEVETADHADPELVLVAEDDSGERLAWKANRFRQFNQGSMRGKVFTCATVNPPRGKKLTITAFLWNSRFQSFRSGTPQIRISPGNAVLFGIVEPVPH